MGAIYGSSYYTIVGGPTYANRKTWNEASDAAKLLGGDLVAIETNEENTWLSKQFSDYISPTSGGSNFWIGYSDADSEGN